MKSCLSTSTIRKKEGKKTNVRFRAMDDTSDIRLIETRYELSPQDKNDIWYQSTDIHAIKVKIRLLKCFLNERGTESDEVQRSLKMEIFDLRGLEQSIDMARSLKKYIARKSILKYHKYNKSDAIGLGVISFHETASARKTARDTAINDARVAKKDYIEYIHRSKSEIDGRNVIQYSSTAEIKYPLLSVNMPTTSKISVDG
jgi:hypothetical protein